MEISDLKPFEKNPRKITRDKFELLKKSLAEFGDLSGVVFNRKTGHLVGGHQRVQAFKELGGEIVGNEIVVDGVSFSYREVDWDEEKEMRANILANKVEGQWDYDMLANEWDESLLLESGFDDFELGFDKEDGEEREQDKDLLDSSMTSYLDGNIKQVVLFFKREDFDTIMARLDRVMKETGTDSHTDAFLALLNAYESK